MDLISILASFHKTLTDIEKIYYGGDHCCRCGCKGRYANAGTPLFKQYMTWIASTPLAGEVESEGCWMNLPVEVNRYYGKCFCLYFKH